MSALNSLSSLQGRKDEAPNQQLARELAASENEVGIKEIAVNLFNRDKNIQSDCIKVLYEIGYIKPELIAEYTEDCLKLLNSKNNRLVWGAMTALSTIAPIQPDTIYEKLDTIYSAIKQGSVITIDNGIKVLAATASTNKVYNKSIFPFLMEHLKTCRPKEVGQHAESISIAVNSQNKDEFIEVLQGREASLTNSQLARIKKLYKALQ